MDDGSAHSRQKTVAAIVDVCRRLAATGIIS
jgi:hypothetical protein